METDRKAKGSRLVLIESNEETRHTIKRLLTSKGIKVIGEADSLKTGVRLVRGMQPDLLMLELPPNASQTLTAIQRVKEEHPEMGIILLAHEGSPQLILSCLRAGAEEFLTRPLDPAELDRALDHLGRISNRLASARRTRGKILSVFSSKGGIGASSLATNLAVALAEDDSKKTLLVDLNLQMGDLTLMLDMRPRHSLAETAADGSIDDTKLRSLTSRHGSGLYVLTIATRPEDLESMEKLHLPEIYGILSTMFDYVISDVGRHIDERTLEVLDISDLVLLMSSLDVPSIRNTTLYVELFQRLEVDHDKIHLIVNRCVSTNGISLEDFEDTVGRPAYWNLPNDFKAMIAAVDAGNPVVLESPRSEIARSFRGLCERMRESFAAETADTAAPAEATKD